MGMKILSLGGGDISVVSGDVHVTTPDTVSATLTGVYGEWKDAVIALDGDTSGEVDLGASFYQLQIEIPEIDAADVEFLVSRTSGGSFYRLGDGTAVIQCGDGQMTTTVGLSGYQFIKVKTSGPQTAARTFKVRGSNV